MPAPSPDTPPEFADYLLTPEAEREVEGYRLRVYRNGHVEDMSRALPELRHVCRTGSNEFYLVNLANPPKEDIVFLQTRFGSTDLTLLCSDTSVPLLEKA